MDNLFMFFACLLPGSAGEAPAYPASKRHPAPQKEGRMPPEYAPK